MAKLLILGPSYRRKTDPQPLLAIERYDGVYYRIVSKYMDKIRKKKIDIIIITEDLEIVDYKTPLPYKPPKGKTWRNLTLSRELIEEKKEKLQERLVKIIKTRKYEEVFIALNKTYQKILPEITVKTLKDFKGLGPKARALKEWILGD